MLLGAHSKIEIHHENKEYANTVLKSIVKDIFQYEELFSLYKKNSLISELNRNSFITNVNENFLTLIKNSQIISEATSGAFDISVQPLWDLYSNHYFVKEKKYTINPQMLSQTTSLVNWRNILIEGNNINFKNSDMKITLNGIAQGWITDLVAKKLKKRGIDNVLIDLGETYAMGKHLENRPWHIGITDKNGILGKVNIINKALATSGGYGTTFDKSGNNHHIFDPKTGLSANNQETVSIVSNNAWIADALSTAGLSMSRKSLKKVAAKFNSEVYISQKSKLVKL